MRMAKFQIVLRFEELESGSRVCLCFVDVLNTPGGIGFVSPVLACQSIQKALGPQGYLKEIENH